MKMFADILRVVIAVGCYMLWPLWHIYLLVTGQFGLYGSFFDQSYLPLYRQAGHAVGEPLLPWALLLVIVFEYVAGSMMLGRGRTARLGQWAGAVWNLLLAPFPWGYTKLLLVTTHLGLARGHSSVQHCRSCNARARGASMLLPREESSDVANSRRLLARGRPLSAYLLMFLLLFLSVNALFGGYSLVTDPSGGGLGMPVSLLSGSPFGDYLIPGLILLLVLGVFPLPVVLGLWFTPALPALRGLERLTREHWSWSAAAAVGCALVIWIVVQMMILSFWLQPVLLALGLAIVGVCLLPSVRRYYAQPQSSPQGSAR